MVQVVGPNRVWVQVDAAQVDHPGELRGVADHDLPSGSARWEGELDHFDPLRPRLGSALLEEELASGAVRIALERHGSSGYPAKGPIGDRDVVADQVEL